MVEIVEQPWDEDIQTSVRRRGVRYIWAGTRKTAPNRDVIVNSLVKQGYKVFVRKQRLSRTGRKYRYHIYRTPTPVKKKKKKRR